MKKENEINDIKNRSVINRIRVGSEREVKHIGRLYRLYNGSYGEGPNVLIKRVLVHTTRRTARVDNDILIMKTYACTGHFQRFITSECGEGTDHGLQSDLILSRNNCVFDCCQC